MSVETTPASPPYYDVADKLVRGWMLDELGVTETAILKMVAQVSDAILDAVDEERRQGRGRPWRDYMPKPLKGGL